MINVSSHKRLNPDTCPKLIREIGIYRWKTRATGQKAQPIKMNDHGADALRYMVFGLQRLGL